MTKLLSTVAAVALSIGAATVSAQAAPATTVTASEKPAIAQAGCYYRYQYFYVNGVLYYQYRYFCY
jgi:hypothetical protein